MNHLGEIILCTWQLHLYEIKRTQVAAQKGDSYDDEILMLVTFKVGDNLFVFADWILMWVSDANLKRYWMLVIKMAKTVIDIF